MLRLLKRTWKYLVAALTGRLAEMADPRVQIEQAIDEAKRQHELLSQQAAAVLGNRRELELKLARQFDEVEKLQASARQSLVFADQATKGGDTTKAQDYEQTAQAFATKLVAAESSMKDLKSLHDASLKSAESAKEAVEQNAFMLQKKLAEKAKLLSQLEHTKMQERMNEAMRTVSALAVSDDVPSLEEVRQKIETRYARALGQAEITADSVEVKMLEVEKATIDSQGAQRLEDIRKSLSLESGSRPEPTPIEETKSE